LPRQKLSHVEMLEAERIHTLREMDHLDVGRGDMLVDPARPPMSVRSFRARIVWMSETALSVTRPYLIKQRGQTVCANIVEIRSRLDVVGMAEEAATELRMNDIGIVDVETHRPVFIVIDPISNLTIAAGLIESALENKSRLPHMAGHRGLAVWLTGLSSAGKSTLSRAVYERLRERGYRVELLDGDEVRRSLCRDLGFSKQDRDENIRRIGFLAELLTRNGVIVLVGVISPYRKLRDEVRASISNFIEVYVNAPLSVCEGRDVKGLYKKARAGEIPSFTGIDDPYEPPLAPEVECRTDLETIPESADKVVDSIVANLQSHHAL
jgi:adenylyl-sulfate kinase